MLEHVGITRLRGSGCEEQGGEGLDAQSRGCDM